MSDPHGNQCHRTFVYRVVIIMHIDVDMKLKNIFLVTSRTIGEGARYIEVMMTSTTSILVSCRVSEVSRSGLNKQQILLASETKAH